MFLFFLFLENQSLQIHVFFLCKYILCDIYVCVVFVHLFYLKYTYRFNQSQYNDISRYKVGEAAKKVIFSGMA